MARPTHYDIILHCYPWVFVVNTSGPETLPGPRHDYKSVLLDLQYWEFVVNPLCEAFDQAADRPGFIEAPLPEVSCWGGSFMGKEVIIRPWDMESPGSALNVFFRREDRTEAMAFKLAYC